MNLEEEAKTAYGKGLEELKSLEIFGKRETHDTYIAAEILLKICKDQPVSDDQIEFLKSQSIDLTKVVALIGLQAVPGSSLAIIALEKVLEKHNLTIFPKTLTDPKM